MESCVAHVSSVQPSQLTCTWDAREGLTGRAYLPIPFGLVHLFPSARMDSASTAPFVSQVPERQTMIQSSDAFECLPSRLIRCVRCRSPKLLTKSGVLAPTTIHSSDRFWVV